MKLEHKDLPMIFSETPIPDIFFTDYLPELSGDCLKLYLYMNFLSKHNKTVKVNDLTKKLSLSFGGNGNGSGNGNKGGGITDFLCVLEEKGLITKKPSGYIVNNIQEITLNKLYKPNLTMSEEKVKTIAKHDKRAKAIEHINNMCFQGVMGPSWFNDIDLWFDKYGFDEQVMISLFDHCYNQSTLNRKYVHTVAEAWFNENIKTMSDVEAYWEKRDHFNILKNTISKKLGKRGNLTEYEEDYIKKWVYDYGYDLDVIEIAMKRTTFKQAPTFAYLDTLISDWHERKLKTPSEVSKFIETGANKGGVTGFYGAGVNKGGAPGFYGTKNTGINGNETVGVNKNGTVKKAPSAKGISAYAQRTYKDLDFLYSNKKKEEA